MCLQYQQLFNTHVVRTARPLSTYHFSAIFAWSDFFRFEFELIDDQLCVFAFQGKDSFLYLPPLGETLKPSVIDACFKRMGQRPIARIENILDNQLQAFPQSRYNHYLKAQEYVYRSADLKALSGNAYKSKRHDLNSFTKHFPKAIFREFLPKDKEGCLRLYAAWAKHRQDKETELVYVQMLEENAQVHAKLIEHAFVLGLIGRVVELDGEIIGYTFGYPLNETTFCVALEIVDLHKVGLAAFIFNRFCLDGAVSNFEFINTMDDFGMPNIARAKASYHPVQILPVYNIRYVK